MDETQEIEQTEQEQTVEVQPVMDAPDDSAYLPEAGGWRGRHCSVQKTVMRCGST